MIAFVYTNIDGIFITENITVMHSAMPKIFIYVLAMHMALAHIYFEFRVAVTLIKEHGNREHAAIQCFMDDVLLATSDTDILADVFRTPIQNKTTGTFTYKFSNETEEDPATQVADSTYSMARVMFSQVSQYGPGIVVSCMCMFIMH